MVQLALASDTTRTVEHVQAELLRSARAVRSLMDLDHPAPELLDAERSIHSALMALHRWDAAGDSGVTPAAC
jgi:hypothetical protein